MVLEGLLALLQRGELEEATELEQHAALAERLLYGKRENIVGAAVGGYYLLRTNDYERLHDWASNLADWFEWMADGPIIHAWQIIGEYRKSRGENGSGTLEKARKRLLLAARRGFPIYTEGLRLLRDGLLLFDQRAEGTDKEVRTALRQIGGYVASANWNASTTTFIGKTPNEPSPERISGVPESTIGLEFLQR